jgi:hypothetical protein
MASHSAASCPSKPTAKWDGEGWLPLKDLFCNQEISLGTNLNDMLTSFSNKSLFFSRKILARTMVFFPKN